ncbi:uncharacterized protein LOC108086639 [Drosophila ficusphila]|uniref:uncharacterized protein LOC108086639 n=1 Tax=Drosophila ficusphila TaxID=30025 RepID=UPI0007E64270|nr:uncharacterized protein LOC108086639 [Drosophila ficusphila]
MFLAKNATGLRPQILNEVKGLAKAGDLGSLFFASRRHRTTCNEKKEAAKKCEKYRPTNALKAECLPVKEQVPPFYRQVNPCKTDPELAVQHPKYLGVYGRCDIPYKPEPHCQDPCDLAVRLDDTHYTPGKYLDREYEKYWVECFFRKQKRCCKKVPPERTYRVISNKCGAAAKMKPCKTINPMPCKQEAKQGPCPKFSLCDCKPANVKTNCKLAPRNSRCRRRPCQYPAFSECDHEDLGKGRPIECRCLEVPPMCLVYRYALLDRRLPCEPTKPRDEC